MSRQIITEQVLILRSCWIGNDVVEAGQVISVSRDTASRLVGVKAATRKLPEIKQEVKTEVKKASKQAKVK